MSERPTADDGLDDCKRAVVAARADLRLMQAARVRGEAGHVDVQHAQHALDLAVRRLGGAGEAPRPTEVARVQGSAPAGRGGGAR